MFTFFNLKQQNQIELVFAIYVYIVVGLVKCKGEGVVLCKMCAKRKDTVISQFMI